MIRLLWFSCCFLVASCAVINFQKEGGKPGDSTIGTCRANTKLLNHLLATAAPGSTLLIPPSLTFWVMGGIHASNIRQLTIALEGTLKFWAPDELMTNRKEWPHGSDNRVEECIYFENVTGLTLTSKGAGVLEGNGHHWWGAIKYLEFRENRPRLFHVESGSHLLVENVLFHDSPYWTTFFHNVYNLTVRNSRIIAKVDPKATHHTAIELTAFNTDGFDVAGSHIHIHDSYVWNQDDCFCVKDVSNTYRSFGGVTRETVAVHPSLLAPPGSPWKHCTSNMLFERNNASGLGLTIGSIGSACVKNITFRDSTMVNTFKGLYLKTHPSGGEHSGIITDILYQNITLYRPEQWAIWIGPQQAIYSGACSLLWPDPGTKCPIPAFMDWRGITMRDIFILHPKTSPGVIIGNSTNPMTGIVFDNVVATDAQHAPWGDLFYACHGVVGTANKGTHPIPPCFNGGCIPDGKCRNAQAGVPCCSGKHHKTIDCPKGGRCGA
eukprot:TRINITY_DN75042_c0_g1_i1.p1 TRINITY_DN75042_c0_g1~~TRINITY_DN75042_c0_g1_i1.p1  ORF type:complete len:493 (-),score=16.00 TRINITY_DN75042_c0_g1_i1:28-1506(-)